MVTFGRRYGTVNMIVLTSQSSIQSQGSEKNDYPFKMSFPILMVMLVGHTQLSQYGQMENSFQLEDWNFVSNTNASFWHILFVTQRYSVSYLRSKETDCNEWYVVGKVNTWLSRDMKFKFIEFTMFSRNSQINKVSKLFVMS